MDGGADSVAKSAERLPDLPHVAKGMEKAGKSVKTETNQERPRRHRSDANCQKHHQQKVEHHLDVVAMRALDTFNVFVTLQGQLNHAKMPSFK